MKDLRCRTSGGPRGDCGTALVAFSLKGPQNLWIPASLDFSIYGGSKNRTPADNMGLL